MSQINTNAILDASGGTSTTVNGYTPTASNMAGRNRIINGDMRVSQRFGATSTGTISGGAYTLDRWLAIVVGGTANLSAQQTTTAPTGFYNSLAVTVGTGVTPAGTDERSMAQKIEGLNVADLAWGTANAKPVTISFWVRSSVTGTFGFTITNNAFNRTLVQSYVINSADTWEHKTITISGDTSGTWLKDNGAGIALYWDLGVGTTYSGTASSSWQAAGYEGLTGGTKLSATTGATFYITGVQLEEGSVATPFEHRQYGQELALCERYFRISKAIQAYSYLAGPVCFETALACQLAYNFSGMRTTPTFSASGSFAGEEVGGGMTVASYGLAGSSFLRVSFTATSASTAGFSTNIRDAGSNNASFSWSAEL